MMPRGILSLCSVLSLLLAASHAQILTVTTHISACAATYPLKSTASIQSTTVVQSTVTVQPTPLTDQAINNGTPFVISLYSASGSTKRQASQPYWLMANGNTTTNASLATSFQINNGQLSTTNGNHYSTNIDVTYQAFASFDYILPINATFESVDGSLTWYNADFTNGTAQFYKVPATSIDNARLLVRFLGSGPEPGWGSIALNAEPVSTVASVSAATSLVASSAAVVNPTSIYSGSFVAPTAVSQDGLCGGPTGEMCTGSSFGNCCSEYGHCGSTETYCSAGCQVAFGNCDLSQYSLSSMASMTSLATSGMPVSSPVALVSSNLAMGVSSSSAVLGMGSSSPAASLSSITPSSMMIMSASGSSVPVGSSSSSSVSVTLSLGPGPVVAASSSALSSIPSSGSSAHTSSTSVSASSSSSHTSIPTSIVVAVSSSSQSAPMATSISSLQSSSSVQVLTSSSSSSAVVMMSSSSASLSVVSSSSISSSSSLVSSSSKSDSSSGSGSSSLSSPQASSSVSSSGYIGTTTTTTQRATTRTTTTTTSTSSSFRMTTTTTTTSTSSSPTPSVLMCPSINGTDIVDSNGNSYYVLCDTDSQGGLVGQSSPTGGGISQCATACDNLAGCVAFTYSGDSTLTMGTCYLKSSSYGDASANSNIALAVLVSAQTFVSTTRTTTTTTSLSSDLSLAATTTTTTTPPSSSSSSSTTTLISSSSSIATTTSTSSLPLTTTTTTTSSSSLPLTTATTTTTSSSLKPTTTTTTTPSSSSFPVTTTTKTTSTTTTTSSSSTATPSVLVCPGINGTDVTDSSGYSYYILCDADFQLAAGVGNSVSVNGNGISACLTACDSTAGCEAFTYSGDSTLTGGTCYLKSSYSGTTSAGSDIARGVLVGSAGSAARVSSSSSTATTPLVAATSFTVTTSTTTSSSSSLGTTVASSSTTSSVATSTSSAAAAASSTTAAAASSSTGLILGTPVPCNFDVPSGTDEDDDYCEVDLPFEMQMFSYSSSLTYPSTNGILAIGTGSAQYLAQTLPDTSIPPATACPYFDDLYYYASRNDGEGIFYTINEAQTTVLYNYVLSRGGTYEIYNFTVFYDSTVPGVFTYIYAETGGAGNEGASASVGIQGDSAGGSAVGVQYSYNQADIVPGLVVVCDTNAGTCVKTSS